MGLLTVRDEWTKLVGHRFLNSQLCVWIGLLQMLICLWGVAQHGHSYWTYNKILQCNFSSLSPLESTDAVIFDVGLFSTLWGIHGCVAEYIDGGFGRLVWCLSHCLSLLVSLPFAFVTRPRPCYLWPLLIQQSLYGICLLILLLAALPRILPLLTEPHAAPILPIGFYVLGTTMNFFLLYIYWHWYWHVASMWSTAVRVRFGQVLRNANNRSRRDRPMLPKEPMDFSPPLPSEPTPPFPPVTPEDGVTVTSSSTFDCIPNNDVIVATRLHPNCLENVVLRQQDEARRVGRGGRVAAGGRRRLPVTPDEPVYGELERPVFYLPQSMV